MPDSRFLKGRAPTFIKTRGDRAIESIKRFVPPPPVVSEGVLLLETGGTDDLLHENDDRMALE